MKNIHIKENLNELHLLLRKEKRVFAIIDDKLEPFFSYFEPYDIIPIKTSEKDKTLSTAEKLVSELLERGADRSCFLLGVGGGITTDLCGFAASIYKRGVRFGFVPTTLLAQVDASIGGKNGVNFHAYKNIIGTITQPEWLYLCTDLLKTLPPREFRAGIAEVLKTFILFDAAAYARAADYFEELESFRRKHGSYCLSDAEIKTDVPAESGRFRNTAGPAAPFYKQETLAELIRLCAEYKCGVVERDAFERGERRLLNLGHTFAHAIEKNCTIMHGEAVGIGMILAARIACKLGMAPASLAETIARDLERTGLPVRSPVAAPLLLEALSKDKKVEGDRIHFILPLAIGNAADHSISLKQLEEISLDLC